MLSLEWRAAARKGKLGRRGGTGRWGETEEREGEHDRWHCSLQQGSLRSAQVLLTCLDYKTRLQLQTGAAA